VAKKTSRTPDWQEIGTVEAGGVAARVGIVKDGGKVLPGVQLGTMKGDKQRRFSPYLHPTVVWKRGKGSIEDVAVPPALRKKIAALLKPHLVQEPSEAIRNMQGYQLVEVKRRGGVATTLGCLSCS
jgi:hypothetical protein